MRATSRAYSLQPALEAAFGVANAENMFRAAERITAMPEGNVAGDAA